MVEEALEPEGKRVTDNLNILNLLAKQPLNYMKRKKILSNPQKSMIFVAEEKELTNSKRLCSKIHRILRGFLKF